MNHITIAGRVEEDPVRKEVNGRVLCCFRLASGRSGSKAGRMWIDVDTWGPLAGTCYRHIHKSRTVIVAGRLTQKQWADPQTGEKRTRYVITATDVDLLPSAQVTTEGHSGTPCL